MNEGMNGMGVGAAVLNVYACSRGSEVVSVKSHCGDKDNQIQPSWHCMAGFQLIQLIRSGLGHGYMTKATELPAWCQQASALSSLLKTASARCARARYCQYTQAPLVTACVLFDQKARDVLQLELGRNFHPRIKQRG